MDSRLRGNDNIGLHTKSYLNVNTAYIASFILRGNRNPPAEFSRYAAIDLQRTTKREGQDTRGIKARSRAEVGLQIGERYHAAGWRGHADGSRQIYADLPSGVAAHYRGSGERKAAHVDQPALHQRTATLRADGDLPAAAIARERGAAKAEARRDVDTHRDFVLFRRRGAFLLRFA